jgi:DNA-binding NarL/FixJ family response regulator
MERIRQAYLEGKGIKRIAREFHHATRTVRKAIRMEAENPAQVEARAKEPVA